MQDIAAAPELIALVDGRLNHLADRCREAGVPFYDDAGVTEHLKRVLLASDYAYESLLREPALLGPGLIGLMGDPRAADARASELTGATTEADQLARLRCFRRREALRLIWRDVNGFDGVEQTLAGASALAEACLESALTYAEHALTARHGVARTSSGQPQRLVVLGLGKLGGSELNFSSDIDLILAFQEGGQTDGARALDNETYFARVGQQIVKLLAEVTTDGYVYRVDLRLRPFGSAGRVALSFAALEQYYQREGRDWERYAWIKARPVAGDLAAGKRLIETLRPFVYRRYLDYTAFAGLREMKALIDAEVARKDLAQDLKLGSGGIREIEFIVQLLQLIRAGREPSLRERGLLPALAACEQLGVLSTARTKRLRDAYLFLRQLENRVQMLRDEQTHELPEDKQLRARIATALNYPDPASMTERLARIRADVTEEFAALMAPVRMPKADSAASTNAAGYWQRLVAGTALAEDLAALGFAQSDNLHAQLVALTASTTVRNFAAGVRARFDRLLPQLLEETAASPAPDACFERLLRLVQSVMRRSAYLALLQEQPVARARLIALFADSAFLAERVIAHPLLLDELFDARLEITPPDRAQVATELVRRLAMLDDVDPETEIEVLQEEKHSAIFRLGLAHRAGRLDAVQTTHCLSETAEAIVAHILMLAQRDVVLEHGHLGKNAGLAVLAYGSLGGAELGFASDLDLVFVYNGTLASHESDGKRPLDGMRYYARIAQRVVHWLTTPTHAGKLYDVDVRLRPDGGKGLLVVSLEAFADYQRTRAWIWEQQALVRARAIAGDVELITRFTSVRGELLAQPRDRHTVCEQVLSMRERWRAERDRSTAVQLDLKQGAGALLDIEFLLQALVLLHAHAHPQLLISGNNAELITLAGRVGVLDAAQSESLQTVHAALLGRALACTLDARPRLVPRDAELGHQTAVVLEVAAALGLPFA